MRPLKVLTVVGTRPEAIKMAPVVRELHAHREQFESQVCATGQHREMLDQALALFDLRPDFDLGIMAPAQTLAQVTARAVQGLDEVLRQQRPDVVLVQGDTTTAMCGALTAYYHAVKVGHVEAGLRTGDKYAPFPEEMNRRLVAPLADYHFAPTEHARQALLKEGVDSGSIVVTGNPVIDALLWMREKVAAQRPPLPDGVAEMLEGRLLVLVTGHRRESFGAGFENICRAIREVADVNHDAVFVYPVHLNPSVLEPVERILGGHPRIKLIKPLSYAPFVWLMNAAAIVLTDSGGVQEEAPSLGKPVLVMRETTERPEGLAAGNAKLVGTQKQRIVDELSRLLGDTAQRAAMARTANPYGDGFASRRIVETLRNLRS